jgi:hypothetical protein
VTGRRIPAIAVAGIGLRIPPARQKSQTVSVAAAKVWPDNLWLQSLLSCALQQTS